MKETVTLEFKDKIDKEHILGRINKIATGESLRDKIEYLTYPTVASVLATYEDRYKVNGPDMESVIKVIKFATDMYIKISNTDMSDNSIIIKDTAIDNYRGDMCMRATARSISTVKLDLYKFMNDMSKRIARDMNRLERIALINLDIKQLEIECRMKPEIGRKTRFNLFNKIEVTESDFDIRYRCIL